MKNEKIILSIEIFDDGNGYTCDTRLNTSTNSLRDLTYCICQLELIRLDLLKRVDVKK